MDEPVMAAETAADNLKAKGLDDRYARTDIRSKAHLTNREAEIVKAVARRCNADYEAETLRGVAEVRELQRQYPRPSQAPPEVAQKLNSLEQRRDAVVTACVQDLKSQMPTYRFQKLHDWVTQNVAPQIKQAPAVQRPAGKQ